MSTIPYPSTLAELHFPQSSSDHPTHGLYSTLRQLRRNTLSIHNRLNSILQDSQYAQSVSARYDLPLIANERCGSWYVPPSLKAGSAYFKSTDGHHGQWDFSLRRLNFELLKVLGQTGGAVMVDSTRRGKRVPDALGKTVPVWVAVINRTLFPDSCEGRLYGLQCERGREGLGESEISQIEARIGGFVERFRGLGVDIDGLRKVLKRPIQIEYAVNGYEMGGIVEPEWDTLQDIDLGALPTESERQYNLLVLCSVSRRVRGAEISEGGYIQGAGDDSESWSHGLNPEVFWANRDLLMGSPEQELPDVVQELVEAKKDERNERPVLIGKTRSLYIAASPDGKTNIGDNSEQKAGADNTAFGEIDLTINCSMKDSSASYRILDLGCRKGKLGSRDLREKLPAVKSFVTTMYERKPDSRILVTCSTGKDLAVGVAVMLLCLFYNDSGAVGSSLGASRIDKTLVKKRLAWISSSKPDISPSRSTLQSVNAFLMERP